MIQQHIQEFDPIIYIQNIFTAEVLQEQISNKNGRQYNKKEQTEIIENLKSMYNSRVSSNSSSKAKPGLYSKYVTSLNFMKNKEIQSMYLNKTSIVRRLQSMMLQVKDLQTKMFVSKAILYIQTHANDEIQIQRNEKPLNKTMQFSSSDKFKDLRESKFAQSLNQLAASDSFANNCRNKSILNQLASSTYINKSSLTSSFCSHKNSRYSSQLSSKATSPLKSRYQDKQNSISQTKYQNQDKKKQTNTKSKQTKQNDTILSLVQVSQKSIAKTIQCQCGLFRNLLTLIERLIDRGILQNKNTQEVWEIDDQAIQKITQEIIHKFQNLQINASIKLKSQNDKLQKMQKMIDFITKKGQTQIKLIQQKYDKLKISFNDLNQSNKALLKEESKIHPLKRQVTQLQLECQAIFIQNTKLHNSLSQVQNQQQNTTKQVHLLQKQVKQYELQINRLKFECQLKEAENRQLIVIRQTLQKKIQKGQQQRLIEVNQLNIQLQDKCQQLTKMASQSQDKSKRLIEMTQQMSSLQQCLRKNHSNFQQQTDLNQL